MLDNVFSKWREEEDPNHPEISTWNAIGAFALILAILYVMFVGGVDVLGT